jgi:hypothetical protein
MNNYGLQVFKAFKGTEERWAQLSPTTKQVYENLAQQILLEMAHLIK